MEEGEVQVLEEEEQQQERTEGARDLVGGGDDGGEAGGDHGCCGNPQLHPRGTGGSHSCPPSSSGVISSCQGHSNLPPLFPARSTPSSFCRGYPSILQSVEEASAGGSWIFRLPPSPATCQELQQAPRACPRLRAGS